MGMQFVSHAGAWGALPAPPPVMSGNTRVFTRRSVIPPHNDPVRAAVSTTHPTCRVSLPTSIFPAAASAELEYQKWD